MITQRMFVAIRPPETIREQIAEFLSPRGQLTWIDRAQWHITLAFLPAVPTHRELDLVDVLGRTVRRHKAFRLSLSGAGAFPDPLQARVLWLRPTADLGPLAMGVRRAANSVGATADGQRFVGHLSVARLRRPLDARRWLQVLQTFEGDAWVVDEVELVASHLAQGPRGRPRHETMARLALAAD